jgi:hypothetical protein
MCEAAHNGGGGNKSEVLSVQQHLPLVLLDLAKRPNVFGDSKHVGVLLS